MIITNFSRILPEESKKCILHIGAHSGGEAAAYEAAGYKNIYWVEADPEIFPKLRQNVISRKGANHTAFQALITRSSGGTRTFHRFSNNGASNSVFRSNELFCKNINNVEETGETVELPEISLDDLVAENSFHPTTLVVDVQGAELEVLKGSVNTIDSIWVIEVEVSKQPIYEGGASFEEVDQFLVGQGFQLVTHVPWHGDVVYLKSSKFDSNTLSLIRKRARILRMCELSRKLKQQILHPKKFFRKIKNVISR